MTNESQPEQLPANEDPLLSHSFDLFQRYRAVADVVRSLLRPEGRPKILDSGGAGGILSPLLPDCAVYVADTAFAPGSAERLVVANGTRLPFPDGAFDHVVSVDVLEHIPPPHRTAYLEELGRVSRDAVIIAAPFASGLVEQHERMISACYRVLYGVSHKWLDEHIEYGLPGLEQTLHSLNEAGYATVVAPNGYLHHWASMMLLQMISTRAHPEQVLFARLCHYYNDRFYDSDNREPSYRHVVLARRGPVPREILEARSPPVDGQPLEAALLLGRWVVPLIAAGKEREERLQSDIDGLSQSVEALKAELAHVTQALEQGLAEAERYRAQVQQLEAAAEQQRAEAAQLRKEIEHQAADASQLRREIEDRKTEAAQLRKEIDHHMSDAGSLRAELTRIQAGVAWTLLVRYRRLYVRLLPPGSGRERLYRWVLRVCLGSQT